ncbi:MAG: hypothetical protein PVJ57_06060 [Phycisphaerae bacterium]|jgi:hypothetical protein
MNDFIDGLRCFFRQRSLWAQPHINANRYWFGAWYWDAARAALWCLCVNVVVWIAIGQTGPDGIVRHIALFCLMAAVGTSLVVLKLKRRYYVAAPLVDREGRRRCVALPLHTFLTARAYTFGATLCVSAGVALSVVMRDCRPAALCAVLCLSYAIEGILMRAGGRWQRKRLRQG